MPFDQNVQQQLMQIAMQDPQTFQQISQNANMMASRNSWNGNQNGMGYQFNSPQNYGMTVNIRGRVIADPQEIRPNEISQDGVPSYFPTRDYTTIYAKAWNANGGIDTVKYVLEQPVVEPQGPSEFDLMMERIDRLEQSLSQQMYQRRQNNYQNNNNNRNRKGNEEVTSNDES